MQKVWKREQFCSESQEQRKKKHVHSVAQHNSEEYEEILYVTETGTENVCGVENIKRKDIQLFAGMLLGKDVVKF